MAGYTIYKFYLDKTGNKTEAIKKYKGIKSKKTYWIVEKYNRVLKEIKDKYLN